VIAQGELVGTFDKIVPPVPHDERSKSAR